MGVAVHAIGKPAHGFFHVAFITRNDRRLCASAGNLVGRKMVLAFGYCDCKCAAFAEHTFDTDRPAMKAHQFLHQRQSNSGAFKSAPLSSFNAMEALK